MAKARSWGKNECEWESCAGWNCVSGEATVLGWESCVRWNCVSGEATILRGNLEKSADRKKGKKFVNQIHRDMDTYSTC